VPFEVDMNVFGESCSVFEVSPSKTVCYQYGRPQSGCMNSNTDKMLSFYTVFTGYIGESVYVQSVTEITMLCRGMLIGTFVSPFGL